MNLFRGVIVGVAVMLLADSVILGIVSTILLCAAFAMTDEIAMKFLHLSKDHDAHEH